MQPNRKAYKHYLGVCNSKRVQPYIFIADRSAEWVTHYITLLHGLRQ